MQSSCCIFKKHRSALPHRFPNTNQPFLPYHIGFRTLWHIIYHKLSQFDAGALQRLQNVACHATLKADIDTHVDEMHEKLNWCALYQRRCQHICNMIHKFLNGIGPADCAELFVYEHDIHSIATRRAACHLLCIPRTRL